MEKHMSQHYLFAFEALPILFHSQTSEFMKYLERDGIKFLKFWWDHAGDKVAVEKRSSSSGLNFEIQQIDQSTKLVIITMPKPQNNAEAYYLAALAKPEKRFAWVRLPNTRFFALRRADQLGEGYRTIFGELTPRALFRELAQNINPTKRDFVQAVEKTIRRKK